MYAAVSDLIGRFGQDEIDALAGTETPGQLDQARIDAALADASAEINSYLGQRYALPLAEIPPVLIAGCCDIARYQLYAVQPTEEVTKRYQQRIAWLRDIATGKATLGIAEASATAPSLTVAAIRGRADRTFTRDSLSDF